MTSIQYFLVEDSKLKTLNVQKVKMYLRDTEPPIYNLGLGPFK
jgi:hypothetical protein